MASAVPARTPVIYPDVATPRENEWELMRKTCNAALQAQREDIAGR